MPGTTAEELAELNLHVARIEEAVLLPTAKLQAVADTLEDKFTANLMAQTAAIVQNAAALVQLRNDLLSE